MNAVHRLTANADGITGITLELEQRGALAGMVKVLTGGRTRRYMEMETAGLKAANESR
jgi:hypothetical protein